MSETTAVAKVENNVVAGFGSSTSFDFMQRQATMLASSALVPKEFSIVGVPAAEKAQKIANVVIALEMANRIGASPFSVMQNIYIVHGKPSWSSTFVIASINGCGRFNAMKFEMTGEGDNRTCVAVATERATGDKLESPPISIEMAKAEGWYGKAGSKWKTMPELMLRYRAATLFGRLYAPEILMGMRSVEEVDDIETAQEITPTAASIMDRFKQPAIAAAEEVTTEETETVAIDDAQQTLLVEVYTLLDQLSQISGDPANDLLDNLTKGKISVQQDLQDKPVAYLVDIKLWLENAIAAEA